MSTIRGSTACLGKCEFIQHINLEAQRKGTYFMRNTSLLIWPTDHDDDGETTRERLREQLWERDGRTGEQERGIVGMEKGSDMGTLTEGEAKQKSKTSVSAGLTSDFRDNNIYFHSWPDM